MIRNNKTKAKKNTKVYCFHSTVAIAYKEKQRMNMNAQHYLEWQKKDEKKVRIECIKSSKNEFTNSIGVHWM